MLAMRAVAQGLADEGNHFFAGIVTREADFRDDVNLAIHGYRAIIAGMETQTVFDSPF